MDTGNGNGNGNKPYPLEDVIEACKGSGGIQAVVAKRVGCTRTTICRYAKKYATVRQALYDADEEATDLAESKLLTLINTDYWPAIKYRLETKGKDRGYVQQTDVTTKGESLNEGRLSDAQRAALIAALLERAGDSAGGSGADE